MTPEQKAQFEELKALYKAEKKEEQRLKNLEYNRQYYQTHKKERAEVNRRWRERNPERAKEIEENSIIRRAERILAERRARHE